MTNPDTLILETQHLSKSFGEIHALKNVNMKVHLGDIYVLLGPNGAGKTTTMNLITGLYKPSGGHIRFQNSQINISGFIGGHAPVYPHLSAVDNLKQAFLISGNPVDQAQINNVLDKVNLRAASSRLAGEFSTGMQQRLGIARALLFNPDLIVLDEPTSGLDPEGIAEMRELILSMNIEEGITWLISSHILGEVEKIATRVCIIKDGTQRIESSLEDMHKNKNVFMLKTSSTQMAITHLPADVELLDSAEGYLMVQLTRSPSPSDLIKVLVENGIPIHEVSPVKHRLEKLYFQICYGTGDNNAAI
ncbi:MAG: ATP-binding cassette domain-containing protein [Anaerolineae bacterium]|nr:ATP-binding cassette domain-containing protein [Anaerolineae bacterium]